MALFDFEHTPLDGAEDSQNLLYDELENSRDSEIHLRAGYDKAPTHHDLQLLLTPESPRFQETSSQKVENLYDLVDEQFQDSQYVDWTTTSFDQAGLEDTEEITYSDGSTLTVQVYEPGEEGHDILRL